MSRNSRAEADGRITVGISYEETGGSREFLTLCGRGRTRKFALYRWCEGACGAGEISAGRTVDTDPDNILVFPSASGAFLHILGCFLSES